MGLRKEGHRGEAPFLLHHIKGTNYHYVVDVDLQGEVVLGRISPLQRYIHTSVRIHTHTNIHIYMHVYMYV